MDQPGIDPVAHSQALQGLRRINAFSGAVGSLFAPIRSLARENATQQLRVLDLACGGGDNTTALAERARREGLDVQIDGCDLSPQAVAIATRRLSPPAARMLMSSSAARTASVADSNSTIKESPRFLTTCPPLRASGGSTCCSWSLRS